MLCRKLLAFQQMSNMIHCFFGFSGSSLDDIKERLEEMLSLKLEIHDSLYYGGQYYRWSDAAGNVFRLQSNYGILGDEWAEEEFMQWPILLYASVEGDFDAVVAWVKVARGTLLHSM